jgi:hypothetical protein
MDFERPPSTSWKRPWLTVPGPLETASLFLIEVRVTSEEEGI